MTDIMFTRTALTEAAETAGVTAAQARTVLEAAGVKVQPEKPALPTEPGSVILATEVRGERGEWRLLLDCDHEWYSPVRVDGRLWHHPDQVTAWTEAHIVPEGEPIDLGDVRAGDRVRVVLDSGDEATFTVTEVSEHWFASHRNAYRRRTIRTVHLLHREEA